MNPFDWAMASNGNPGEFRDARIEVFGRIALWRRTGQRREIIGQGKMLRLGQRLLAERAFAFELGRSQRRQLQSGAKRKAVAAELKGALKCR